ncbi:hypothetical protein ABK040_003300 [Willaertia magna]
MKQIVAKKTCIEISKQKRQQNKKHNCQLVTKFVDETTHASRRKKMKRLRKPLKHEGLLQNYFEWSGNSNEVVTRFEMGLLEEDDNNNDCRCCSLTKEEELETQTDNQQHIDPLHAQQTTTCINNGCCNDFNQQLQHDGSIIPYNGSNMVKENMVYNKSNNNNNGLIIVSDMFHLKLDVEDFIKSYNELIINE